MTGDDRSPYTFEQRLATVVCERSYTSDTMDKEKASEQERETYMEIDPINFLNIKMEPPDEDSFQDEAATIHESEDDNLPHENGTLLGLDRETENWNHLGNDIRPKVYGKVQTLHKCPACYKVFSHRGDLRKHFFTHTGERPYSCTECPRTFSQSSNLRTHLRTHSNVQTYKCPHCGQNFSRNESLDAHITLHVAPTSHKCSYCPRVYSHRSKLRRHMRCHSEVLNKCTECGKRYSEVESLVAHMKLHTGEYKHKCEECGKFFTHRGDYRKHLFTHTGERPFPCPLCPKTFSQRSNLRTHLRIHTGEKPHNCGECDRSFTQLANLRKHERVHIKDEFDDISVMNLSPLVLITEGDSELSNEEILGGSLDCDTKTNRSPELDPVESRYSAPHHIKEEPSGENNLVNIESIHCDSDISKKSFKIKEEVFEPEEVD